MNIAQKARELANDLEKHVFQDSSDKRERESLIYDRDDLLKLIRTHNSKVEPNVRINLADDDGTEASCRICSLPMEMKLYAEQYCKLHDGSREIPNG